MNYTRISTIAISAGLATLLVGCAGNSGSRRTTVTQIPPPIQSSTTASGITSTMGETTRARMLTDANIFAILEEVNISTIEESKLAQQRAASPEVRLYAGRMTQEHEVLQQQTSNLASRLNISPSLPAAEREVAAEHQTAMDSLKNKSGEAFDRAYLDHRIQMHEKVLGKLDDAAMEAQQADVRTLLAQVRPGIQAHLKAARDLQRDLSSNQSGQFKEGRVGTESIGR